HRLPAIRPSTITRSSPLLSFSVLFTATAPSELYTLSLHDALPICADTRHLKLVHKITGGEHGAALAVIFRRVDEFQHDFRCGKRSEEHTSELQSRENLVCRLLLEKKNTPPQPPQTQTTTTCHQALN